MAILLGFPPSNTISPSVRIKETDLSFYDIGESFHRAGLIGFASKGPIGIPIRVRTQRELFTTFGFPHPEMSDPYLIYAASQYLNIANELWVVRVAEQRPTKFWVATTAKVDVPSAGGEVLMVSDTPDGCSTWEDSENTIPTNGNYTFPHDAHFRWKLNGVLASKQLTVLADDSRPAPLTGHPYTALQLREDLMLQLSEDDGIAFVVTHDSRIGVTATFSYGPEASIELVACANSMYGGAVVGSGGTNITGLGTGMTRGILTSLSDTYPADGSVPGPGNWDFTSVAADDVFDLKVVVNGTNTTIDGKVQVVDLSALAGTTPTTAEVVAEINYQIAENLLGGFQAIGGGVAAVDDLKADTPVTLTDASLAALVAADTVTLITNHFGADASLLVKVESTADQYLSLPNVGAEGTSPEGTSDDVSTASYAVVTGSANLTGERCFTIWADSPGIDGNNTAVSIHSQQRSGTFTLEVYNNGTYMESWGNLSKDNTSRFYVSTFIATVSDWIRIEDNTDVFGLPLSNTGDEAYSLAGGSDGIPPDPDEQDKLLVGNAGDMTGMYCFSEPEQVELDLIAIPGHSSPLVMERVIDLCQRVRGDCMAIIDPPFGLFLEEVVQWHNGIHPLNDTKLNSDCAALYWPWVKMTDPYNLVDVWVPPSGSVMAVYARNDLLAAPWYAPAGLTRGVVPNISDVFYRPTLAERDLLYGWRNAVNPIVQFVDVDGFIVWGQKTLQRTPTALDRVNVRRMMFVAEKRIRKQSRWLLFEPHDDQFHKQFIDMASKILAEIQAGRGLHAYRIKADWELNTPERVDRNEFWARIGIQPTKAVEFMFLEFSIHRTGEWNAMF